MIQFEFDKANNLMKVIFSKRVSPVETERGIEQVLALVAGVKPGFCLLTDLTELEFMDPACSTHVERTMDICDEAGIAKVVRVIPDPQKDIGFKIMSVFHFDRRVQMVTCETLKEAEEVLGVLPP